MGLTGPEGTSGEGVANRGLRTTDSCVAMRGVEGVAVTVAAGDEVMVTVDVATNGTAMIPISLPHRS